MATVERRDLHVTAPCFAQGATRLGARPTRRHRPSGKRLGYRVAHDRQERREKS